MIAAALTDDTSNPTTGRASVNGTAGTTAPTADDRTPQAGGPPGPALHLTEEQTASLKLLRYIGGKAYCGTADDERNTTVALTSALALERAGLIELHHRPAYMVAVLLESEVPA